MTDTYHSPPDARLRRFDNLRDHPPTRWSLIDMLKHGQERDVNYALSSLFESYQPSLLGRARLKARRSEDPHDLVQGFFANAIAKRVFAGAERARGRFRSFLATAFDNYIHNKWDHDDAIKRGGGHPHVSVEASADGSVTRALQHRSHPERLYTQEWVRSLLQRERRQLRHCYEDMGNAALFAALECFLDEPYGEEGCYEPIARAFDMTSAAVRKATHDLRRRFRERLRAEIATTLQDPDEVNDEIRRLLAAFDTEA